MGAKKKNAAPVNENSQPPWMLSNASICARNLRSKDLNGVIFGCTHYTMQECIDELLFGLPGFHYTYVRNITPGMALFLFNYSDRKLYGIFEAKTSGQMRISPYAWCSDGSETTQYPAQVRVQYRARCRPLTEEQYKPLIEKNYYTDKHFWFELDHTQTKALIALCSSMQVTGSSLSHPKVKINPPVKTLPPRKPKNQSNSRAGSNFHVLAIDEGSDQASEDERNEASGNDYPEVVQSSEGRSSASVVSNTLSILNEFELDDSIQYQAQVGFAELNTSESPPSWNELGWVEDNPLPEDTLNLGSIHCDVVENDRCFQKEKKSGSETTDPRNKSGVEWEQLQTLISTRVYSTLETHGPGTQSSKETAVTKMKCDISGPPVLKLDSAECPEFSSSEMPGKIHTQMLSTSKGEDLLSYGLSSRPLHTLVTNEKIMTQDSSSLVGVNSEMHLSDQNFILLKLAQELENLKATQILQTWKVNSLEQELAESKEDIWLLKQRYEVLESGSLPKKECSARYPSSSKVVANHNESIFLVGGCDGESWLSSLNLYTPTSDLITTLKPMDSARSYAPATKLNGNIYVLGGVDSETTSCFDTVVSYNPSKNHWITCPPLKRAKGNLAATSVYGKIFAIGGGSGVDCFSEVEMFDENAGMWVQSREMKNKRFAPAAVEIDGIIYVVGGYNGDNYLKSVERFDYREHSWTPVGSMSTARGCHSLAVLDGKIYALGGYDGTRMVSTVEVFDPRKGKWTKGKEMNVTRGYAGAAVLGESIYIMGGMKDHVEVVDTVECYKEGKGWHRLKLKSIGKRCFFSAITV